LEALDEDEAEGRQQCGERQKQFVGIGSQDADTQMCECKNDREFHSQSLERLGRPGVALSKAEKSNTEKELGKNKKRQFRAAAS
jgi:hypothetical protein